MPNESAPVHPDSLTWTGQLELWRDEIVDSLARTAEAGVTDCVSVMSGSNASFAETISPMTYPRVQLADQAAKFKQALSVPVTVAGRIRTPGSRLLSSL